MGKRKAYTPFSTSNEAGVSAAPVEGFIEVTQDVRPTIDTGFVDAKGNWVGHQTSDTEFSFYHKGDAVPNGQVELASTCDMTGFNDIQLAIRPTASGNFAVAAVMGPDTDRYANLSPVNAAAVLKGNKLGESSQSFGELFNDSADTMTADVWNIYMIKNNLANQKLLQFRITNNTGASSDIEVMYLRIV
jgi:hypothetical protein